MSLNTLKHILTTNSCFKKICSNRTEQHLTPFYISFTLDRMEGRRQCDKITFTTPTPSPLQLFICHCLECRHQSSSLFGVTTKFLYFEIPELSPGAISKYTRTADSSNISRCYFCTSCGSRLMHVKEGADTLNVKAGCLEEVGKLEV
jgi:hypothetical protein